MKKNVLIIEPEEITRLLIAKEVQNTNNFPIIVDSYDKGYDILRNQKISLVICDNDFSEGYLFSTKIKEMGISVPLIATSTFLYNQKLVDGDDFTFSVRKPLDDEGYTLLRKEVFSITKIKER